MQPFTFPPTHSTTRGFCINDDHNEQHCILDDPNLCKWDFFSQCAEANPEKARAVGKTRKPRKSFYTDEAPTPHHTPSPRTPPAPEGRERQPAAPLPAHLNSHGDSGDSAPPAPDEAGDKSNQAELPPDPQEEKPPYEAKGQLIEMGNGNIDVTFDMATDTLKRLARQETKTSKEFAALLSQVKDQYFSGRGKKAGWKKYIENQIGYSYQHAQSLLKAHSTPIILEFWDQLGVFKVRLLSRCKGELTTDTINSILPITTREAQQILFPRQPRGGKTSPVSHLIDRLRKITPENLDMKGRQALIKALLELLKNLK